MLFKKYPFKTQIEITGVMFGTDSNNIHNTTGANTALEAIIKDAIEQFDDNLIGNIYTKTTLNTIIEEPKPFIYIDRSNNP